MSPEAATTRPATEPAIKTLRTIDLAGVRQSTARSIPRDTWFPVVRPAARRSPAMNRPAPWANCAGRLRRPLQRDPPERARPEKRYEDEDPTDIELNRRCSDLVSALL